MSKKELKGNVTYTYFDSSVGTIQIGCKDEHIISLNFGEEYSAQVPAEESALSREAEHQLIEYFKGVRSEFDLPLKPEGTKFQQSVWEALLAIPCGETRSYGDIARAIGNPKASRAVGMANNRNPISIIIPCHRVIGTDGSLVGYGGGLDKKVWLLEHEKEHKHE